MTTWLPLESNPDVMNNFLRKLGVSDEWSIVDVYGLEPEMLEWVPKPVKAVILLFPVSEAYEKHRKEQDEEMKKEPPKPVEDLFYMKQIIHNACGTIALVHSIANNKDIHLKEGILKNYLDSARGLNPDERGKMLENDPTFTQTHEEVAQEGQTAADPEMQVNHHFIALINKDGTLYELDGRKSFPVEHGSTNETSFLKDAAKVCKEFMARDPNEVRFTIVALTPTQM
ncbi:ubiquitin carboxyl-terminal hydrolase [Condylostylus longicornis]|uniref:ubiquitin carboxyl-terminal hydrolase n=1 Tax=Condylostylus longicornis TaxID=2530218 RepID=UPI00244D9F72|nr:ubiquitin carboxyl-terminal hydrolase [Condylostylus longicornis]